MCERTHTRRTVSPLQRPLDKPKSHVTWLHGALLGLAAVAVGVYAGTTQAAPPRSGSAKSASAPRSNTAANPPGALPAGAQPHGLPPALDPNQLTIMARVNDEVITREQLAAECLARKGTEILETMINKRLVEQACKARGVHITPDEIDQEIEATAKRFSLSRDGLLRLMEQERHISPLQYARDVIWPTLAMKKIVAPNVQVTPEDVQKAYEANYGEKVQARMIVTSNERRAMEVWEKIKANPDDFEKLAKEYSEDPASRSLGGRVRPFNRHSAYPKIEEEVFKLSDQNRLSSIVQTGEFNYIFLFEKRLPPENVRLEDVEKLLVADIQNRKLQAEMARAFKELETTAKVENFLNPKVSQAVVPPAQDPAVRQAGFETPAAAGNTPAAPRGGSAPLPAGTRPRLSPPPPGTGRAQ